MIGTLTVHHNANYGANLQAYALRACIEKETENEEVRVIDYRNDLIRNLYAVRPWNRINEKPYIVINRTSIKRVIKMALNINGTIVRDLKFAKFRRKYIKTTKIVYSPKQIKLLNCSSIIIGSDQVWNESITQDKDNVFWGNVKTPNTFVGSYAPSFGRSSITDLEKRKLESNIKNFDYITVREPSMVNILSPYTKKKIHVVCDPIFLLSKKEWSELLDTRVNKSYIFVYILERNDELLNMARKISEILRLKVIILSDGLKLRQSVGKYIKTATPLEFMSLLYSAKFVLTNSFHGTAFSVLFNKQFITLPDTKKSARMVEFLENCGLEKRICWRSEDITNDLISKPIEYTQANSVLKEMKNSSIQCLQEMIDHNVN